MPLPKTSISWPIDGGLDTVRAPLVVQPGSFLQLDDVVQERKNEWRRRNGFTQVAADTVPQSAGPFMVATNGDRGIASVDYQSAAAYQAAATSSRWKSATAIPGASNLSRMPLGRADASPALISFASDGTNHIFTRSSFSSSGSAKVCLFDSSSGIETEAAFTGSPAFTSCTSGPAGYLVAFGCDVSGNLRAAVANTTTGTIGAVTLIKTGLSGAVIFDAHYYGGSTITVVARMAAGGYQFIEFNPATGALATDVNKAVGTVSCITCIMEPSGSGRRFIGFCDGTNTKLHVLNSAGAQQDLQTLEAVVSTQITGCATNSGLNAACVYQAATAIRRNTYSAGAVGTPENFNDITSLSSATLTLCGQGWGEPGDTKWFFLVGANTTGASAQRTPILVANTFTAGDAALQVMSPVAPLQGASVLSVGHHLYHAVRTGTRTFVFGMPLFVHYAALPGGSTSEDWLVCAFTHTLLSSAEIAAANVGAPAYRGQSPVLALGSVCTLDGAAPSPVGLLCPPLPPTATPAAAAGGLTLLAQYQWCVVVETEDLAGNVWRSPPSVPVVVTLTGAQNEAALVWPTWQIESGVYSGARLARAKLYRTTANGSQFRLADIKTPLGSVADVTFVTANASAADSLLSTAEILYTAGEVSNICWPASSHVWMHDDRFWSVNRDFRTEVNYSKNLRANRAPETTDSNVVDIDDEFGDITNGCSIEGRGVIFKRNAIYFLQGEGLTDGNTGENYRVTRVSQDVGSLGGSPIVVAGDTVYFVSERGIYSISTSAQVDFAGAGVDRYLNQPLVQTQETVYDGCFLPDRNEVRFVTTSYVLVWNRIFGTWSRWNLSGFRRCLVIDGKMVLFKNDGTVWREGDHTQLTDQGVAFTGVIRGPWVRPNFADGAFKSTASQQGIRLYSARVTYTRTSGGSNATLIGKIYRNNDDAKVETFTSGAIGGSVLSGTGEMRPVNSKCTSFSLALVLPSGDVTVRVDGFSAVVAPRSGELAVAGGSKWPAP